MTSPILVLILSFIIFLLLIMISICNKKLLSLLSKLKIRSLTHIFDIKNRLHERNIAIVTEDTNYRVKSSLVAITAHCQEIDEALSLMKEDNINIKNCLQCKKNDLSACKEKSIVNIFSLSFSEIYKEVANINKLFNRLHFYNHLKKVDSSMSLYDIIKLSKDLFPTSITFHIDYLLKQYRCSDEFSSSYFMDIIINHIKNSIAAKATAIHFEFTGSIPVSKISMVIKDNGTGIPKNKIETLYNTPSFRDFREDVNISLYLSKAILKYYKGDSLLVETSEKGVTFKLILPVTTLYV